MLDILLENKEQILIVQDDFGGTVGLVTMEDVIETLLGVEIVDESDEVEDLRTCQTIQILVPKNN